MKYSILTIIIYLFLNNLDIVLISTRESSIIFFNKVFISIFPFIILSDILLYYDYHLFLKKIFGKTISKLFNIDPSTSIIFILSILSSTPTNSVYIKDMLDSKIIDEKTANKILSFTYFPSISFVIASIGLTLFNSFKIGLILYIFCFVNNILIGIYLRKDKSINIKDKLLIKDKNIFEVLKKSILKGINTSIIILGNLIIFTIISNIISKYINNDIFVSLISGLLELTSGIIKTNNLNINIFYKEIIILFFLCFSGLSIIFQSKSILSDYNIKIKKILITKLVFSILTCLLFICFKYTIFP